MKYRNSHRALQRLLILISLMFVCFSCGPRQEPAAEPNPSSIQAALESASPEEKPSQEKTAPPETTSESDEPSQEAPIAERPSPQASPPPPLYRRGPTEPDAFLKRFFEIAREVPTRRAQQALDTVLADPSTFHFQLIITEVDLKTHALTPHEYRVDHDYLYPASAMKTFASLASLMYLEELSHTYPWIDPRDPLSFNGKSCERKDKANLASGLMTLEHEIKQTQLVSSNKAFNHVFDIVGSERLHEYLLPLFPSLRVYHRLSTNETHEETLRVPPLTICDLDQKTPSAKRRVTLRRAHEVLSDENAPTLNDLEPYTGYGDSRESLEVGSAYIDAKTNRQVNEPMDFTWKNRVSFYDFQRLMYAIYQPKKTHRAFKDISLQDGHKVREADLNMLRASMITYPHNSSNPQYKGAGLSETRFKPLIRGLRLSDKKVSTEGEGSGVLADQNLYYMNKAGKALGFHLDNALIGVGSGRIELNKDYTAKNLKRAVYITVGVYVNRDGIINNNQYEYSEISVPLFDAIGYALGRYLQGEGSPKATSIGAHDLSSTDH